MLRLRFWISVVPLLCLAFFEVAPALAAPETVICSPDGVKKCSLIDRGCSIDDDCLNNIGDAVCRNNFCYLDDVAKAEYNRNKTSFSWGLGTITLQNDLGTFSKPALQIKIPGLNFSDIGKTLDKEGYIHIPYIGEFITALYRYGIALASILAVVLLIKCGVSIILSAGGEEKMAAYHQIGQICIGLIILWGSYAFLYTIDPNLVVFKPLRIKYVEAFPLTSYDKEDVAAEAGAAQGSEQPGYIKYECKAQPATKTLTDTTYDDVFEKYGNCVPYDWRYLKAMAFVESGHRAEVTNCAGFTGLFQTKTKYANGFLASYQVNLGDPAVFESVGKVNPQLQKPEPNTMVGTIILLSSLQLIKDTCPDATESSVRYFMYIGHQSGTGALKYVLKKSCDASNSPKYIEAYYTANKSNRPASDVASESDTGAKRFQQFITDLGVPEDSGKAVDATTCPLTNPKLRTL